MADAPSSMPGTNPPERVTETLGGLREQIQRARESGTEVTDDVVNSSVAALNNAREQATNFVGEKLDGLKTEVAQWRLLDAVPAPVMEAAEITQIAIEDLYQKFKDNTVPFAQTNFEKGVGAMTKMINTLSDTVTTVQEFLAKALGPLLPSLMSLGITVPDWLLPKGLAMKELFAALSANKRTLESSDKDNANMRAVIGLLGELNGTKPLANHLSLELFLARAVEQAPAEKSALTTKDVLDSAKLFAEKVKKAETPATPAAAPAAAAPATPAPAPAGPAPAPAATT